MVDPQIIGNRMGCYLSYFLSNLIIITNMYYILIISGTILGTLYTLLHLVLKINLWGRYYYDHAHFMSEETKA